MGINNNNNKDLEDNNLDFLDRIIKYEDGQMDWPDVVSFFQELVDTGFILNLLGHYHRTAQALINAGEISVRETLN